MFIEALGDGGIAHYTYNLVKALTEQKQDVILFTNKRYELIHESFFLKLYPYMFMLSNRLIKFYPGLNSETGLSNYLRKIVKTLEYPLNVLGALIIAKREKIDIIHFQSVNEIALIMVLAFVSMKFKVVFTIHNVMPRHGQLRFYHRFIYSLMYKLCDHLVIHTNSAKKEIGELYNVKTAKISVIPHGNYKFFVPSRIINQVESKALLGIPREFRTMLFFGAIRPNKGLDILLLAIPIIQKKIKNIKLIIAGEACESYEKYRKLIEQNSLQHIVIERIKYIDNSEIANYFSAADLVVLPYKEVTGSGVLQISYAFGKPVVATDLAGFCEVVENGRSGYLVPVGDVEALATKIIEIISDERKAIEMRDFTRFLCDCKYSWDLIATQTLNLYSKI